MLTENDIAQISEKIVTAYAPIVVGTFGSYAIGRAHERSDLDLFVIQTTSLRPGLRAAAIRRLLFGILHPLDIHIFTAQEFEDSASVELSFTWIISRQARLYHWTEEAGRIVPSLIPRVPIANSSVCGSKQLR